MTPWGRITQEELDEADEMIRANEATLYLAKRIKSVEEEQALVAKMRALNDIARRNAQLLVDLLKGFQR